MSAIFNLGLLRNYQIVDEPGTYIVTVAYTVTERNLILDEHPRYLVSLRTVTFKGLADILELLKDDTESVPFSEVRNYFTTGALWMDDVDEEDLPIKGERVIASFDYKDDILRCVHIELLPRKALEYVDLNKIIQFRNAVKELMTTND